MRVLLAAIALAACTTQPVATATPTRTAALATATPAATAIVAAPTATTRATPSTAPTTSPTTAPARCATQRGGDQGYNRAPRTMRAAAQPGYDRVVIDFGPLGPTQSGGEIPQFTIEQVDGIGQGGSGFRIEMQGSVFIRVHWPAAGGAGEYPGPRRLVPDGAVVREVVFTEFEGATTVGIGLSRQVCPVLSLWPDGRLVLDFWH